MLDCDSKHIYTYTQPNISQDCPLSGWREGSVGKRTCKTDQGSVCSTNVGVSQTYYNSSFRGSAALCWPLQALHVNGAYTDKQEKHSFIK